MYIRRKVFSLMEDEMGEQRYFSTTEYEYSVEVEDRYFSKDDEKDLSTGAKIGIGIGGTAATAAGMYGGSKLLNKHMQKKYDAIKGNEEEIKKLDESLIGKINKVSGKYVDTVEGLVEKTKEIPHMTKNAAGKFWDATTKTWKDSLEAVKENATKLKNGTVNAAGEVWDKTKGTWTTVEDFVKNHGEKSLNNGRKILTGVGNYWKGVNKEGATVGLGSVGNKATIIAPLAAAAGVGITKMIKNKKKENK